MLRNFNPPDRVREREWERECKMYERKELLNVMDQVIAPRKKVLPKLGSKYTKMHLTRVAVFDKAAKFFRT